MIRRQKRIRPSDTDRVRAVLRAAGSNRWHLVISTVGRGGKRPTLTPDQWAEVEELISHLGFESFDLPAYDAPSQLFYFYEQM